MVLLGREFNLRPVAINTTVGLAAIHPYLLYYSQHVRMYTLLMLCALTSLWVFHACIRPGKRSTTAKFAALDSGEYRRGIFALLRLAGNRPRMRYLILWKREYWKRMMVSSALVLVGVHAVDVLGG